MDFYILNLRDTRFDMSKPLPKEAVIRSFLEASGIETGEIKVKASGHVTVFATANPCLRWPEFDGNSGINPSLQLAVDIAKMRHYVQAYDKGKPTLEAIAEAMYHMCNAALLTMGVPADDK